MKRILLALLLVLLAACSGGELGPEVEPVSSFSRIQSEIFEVSCVGCHTAGSQDAIRSGLILDARVSYQNLVGVNPTEAGAKAGGLRRVTPFRPDSSLLYHKLDWEPRHHTYGSAMPIGGPAPSVGQLEFVRRWIATGALRDGDSIDVTLLADRTPQAMAAFEPLAPPARGYQMHLDRFGVAPRFERELFMYQSLGNTSDVWVNRIQMVMRPNSHHFVLYGFSKDTPAWVVPQQDRIRDIRRPNGSLDLLAMIPMGYHTFVAGAMTTNTDWSFPPGVALRVPANTSLDLNSHYVNRTDVEIRGEVYANLHTVDAASVVREAHALNLGNQSITLPPGQRTTISRNFTMSAPVAVFQLTSHMHELGERFVVRIVGGPRNGQVIYETDSWSHPDIMSFNPPIQLATGEGLRSEDTYNNTRTRTVSFGLTSEDEMAIVFGYFYCTAACPAEMSRSDLAGGLSSAPGAPPVP
jgi:hypothetical protein